MSLPGPALFMPTFGGVHICANGPTWSAITTPTSDQWSGLAQYGSTWVASGHGQAGTTPSNSIYSTNAGASWTAGGMMPNSGNSTPYSLRAGAHNGAMIAYGNFSLQWLTADQGLTWSTFAAGGGGFGCNAVESGNGLFVYLDNTSAKTYSSPTGASVVTNAAPAVLKRCWWNPNRNLWLALESGGTRSWTTPDLITYTAGATMPFDSATVGPYGIAQNGSNIVIVYADATSTHASYSTDNGVTFAAGAAFAGGASQSYSVAYGNGIFVCTIALGGATQVSTTGASWIAGSSMTATKTWMLGNDGINGWFALGASGSNDTIANVGLC